jgi:alpha-tubulin suppressor-like RCC1 family protein
MCDILEKLEKFKTAFYYLGYNIKRVSIHERISFFVMNDNTIYALTNVLEELEALFDAKIKYFVEGDKYFMALTNDYKLYSWGENKEGQLGTGDVKDKPIPVEVHISEGIREIRCGSNHSLALTRSNKLYAWGSNVFGQIGNGKTAKQLTPLMLNLPQGYHDQTIVDISCGWSHSIIVTLEGLVFCWGKNNESQLGIENINSMYRHILPTKLDVRDNGEIVKFTKARCGRNYTILLSSVKEIWVTGDNFYGQLGDGTTNRVDIPKKINFCEAIRDICVHHFSHISVALTENNNFYVWGKGNNPEAIITPLRTEFNSFNKVFIEYLKLTIKPIKTTFFNEYTNVQNGRYLVEFTQLDLLGSGGFGSVWEVINKWDKKPYAIKKINFKYKEKIQKEREIEHLQILDYTKSFFVSYHAAWIENNIIDQRIVFDDLVLYIQFEKCKKYTLEELICCMEKDEHLFKNETGYLTLIGYLIAGEVFKQILEGLNYLHELEPPIIHRDLKPNNILIKDNEITDELKFVKIGDFGSAVTHSHEEYESFYDVDTRYAAPEVMEGGHYDQRADVHSLGMIVENLFVLKPRR